MLRARALGLTAISVAMATYAQRAKADEPLTPEEAYAHADEVEIDTRGKEVRLRHNVQVELPPFVLLSDELTISRGKRGLAVEGDGHLDFCPCLGTPVSLGFSGASIAPPGDLFLAGPTLRLFGVPVFWLPYFWFRSPARAGLLPPRVTYRGADGVFIGGGIQWPFSSSDAKRTLTWPTVERAPDSVFVLRAGGYTAGGANVVAAYYSDYTTHLVEWDVRGAAGAKVALTGSDPLGNGKLAYEITAYRGQRALDSTTDLDQAARAYDRGRMEMREHTEQGLSRMYAFGGVSAISVRGRSDLNGMWAGPHAGVGFDERFGERFVVALDVDVFGRGRANLDRNDPPPGSTPTAEANDVRSLAAARTEVRVDGSLDAGPIDLGVSVGSLVVGGGSDDGTAARVQGAGISFARIEPSIPLGRAYGDLLHRLEPGLVAFGAIERHDALPPALLASWPTLLGEMAAFGGRIRSTLGQWGRRDALAVDATGGALVDTNGTDPFARGRATWGSRWIGVGADGGAVFGDAKSAVVAGTVRVGPRDRASVTVRAAEQRGSRTSALRMLDPDEAWMRYSYLATDGATGGATFRLAEGVFALTLGADGDAERRSLLGVRGDLVVQDHCECIAMRLGASRRLGREGLDAWVLFDFGESVRRYRK